MLYNVLLFCFLCLFASYPVFADVYQDIEKGKKCEVDAINGVVSDFGRKYNSPTPINDKTVELIKDIEAGKLTPSFDNLKYYADLI